MKLQLIAVAVSLLAEAGAHAHDPGLSALQLQSSNSVLRTALILACSDAEALVQLDFNHDGTVAQDEFDRARPDLERTAGAALEVSIDGVEARSTNGSVHLEGGGEVHLCQSFVLSAGSQLRVRSGLLSSLPRGHRQYALLRDSDGRPLRDKLLDASQAVFEAQLSSLAIVTETPSSSGGFLLLGVEHIATGYDHLVFLVGLLIAGGTLRASVRIITAFTVAHSITLALAALKVIRLPASVVEPLIAVSIMYVGIENIIRRDLDKRWLLAFVFGLVHGCGFASVLRELGIGANGLAMATPLVLFNLGVELGQLALAALILPAIWKLKRHKLYQLRCVPACSLFVALAGAYWLLERIMSLVT